MQKSHLTNFTAVLLTVMLTVSLLAAVIPASLLASPGVAASQAYGGAPITSSSANPDGALPAGAVSSADIPAAKAVYGFIAAQTAGLAAADSNIIRVQVSVDATAPQLTILTPADGAITGTAATFSAAYNDPSPSSGINTGTAMIHIDNRHQFGCTVTDSQITCNKTGLTNGPHKIEAFVCDTEYNCSTAVWHITVDAVPPVITAAQPTGTINTSDAHITATVSDGSGSGVDAGNTAVTIDGSDATAACAIWAAGIDCDATGLTDGGHSVQITAADMVGNHAVSNWAFTVNTAALGITGHAPSPGSWETSAIPVIAVHFQAAGFGIIDPAATTVILDGEDISAVADRESNGISYLPEEPLAEGSHTVSVSAIDDAGHSGYSEWSFSVDTLSPLLTNESPTGVTTSRPEISAHFADAGSGVDPDSINLSLDGVNETGNATLTGEVITFLPAENLIPGAHSAQVSVADAAGNRKTSAWSFSVPTPTPVPPDNAGAPASHSTSTGYWQDLSSLPTFSGSGSWVISGLTAFPNTYFLPWYEDHPGGDGQQGEIVISNQGVGEAVVNIFIAGENKWQGKVTEGGSETRGFPGVAAGPVKVVCPTGQPLRVTYRVSGTSRRISETPAVSEADLEPALVLPWYETRPAGQGNAELIIANAGTQDAEVDIYLGDIQVTASLKGHYSIKANSAAKALISDASGGPLMIVCANNQPLIATMSVSWRDSFTQVMAPGLSRATDSYYLPDFDSRPGSGVTANIIHVGNLAGRDVHVELRLGDELLRDPDNPDNNSIEISRFGARALKFTDTAGGPLTVKCTDCSLGDGIAVSRQIIGTDFMTTTLATPGDPADR